MKKTGDARSRRRRVGQALVILVFALAGCASTVTNRDRPSCEEAIRQALSSVILSEPNRAAERAEVKPAPIVVCGIVFCPGGCAAERPRPLPTTASMRHAVAPGAALHIHEVDVGLWECDRGYVMRLRRCVSEDEVRGGPEIILADVSSVDEGSAMAAGSTGSWSTAEREPSPSLEGAQSPFSAGSPGWSSEASEPAGSAVIGSP